MHSVRWRIKDVEHLLAKIIRKRIDGNKKYDDICVENYSDVITDLIGIRALHLFKTDFETINKSINSSFVLKEKTVVYVREGDDSTFKQQCSDLGFSVEVHPNGYRSIHYVLKTQPLQRLILVELQVRTIFEEGWSEIDHIVRYPNYSDDAQLAYLLTIFNRMAGNADEMAGFVRALAEAQRDSKAQLDDAKAQLDDALHQLSDAWRKNGESLAKDESVPEKVATNNAPIEAVQDALQYLKSRIEAMEDPGGIKAYLKSIEGSAGIRAQLRAIEDPGGIKAMMKEVEDPGGIKALMKEVEDPGGIKALIKEAEDPGGIKALMKEVEDPGGIKALMKNMKNQGGISNI